MVWNPITGTNTMVAASGAPAQAKLTTAAGTSAALALASQGPQAQAFKSATVTAGGAQAQGATSQAFKAQQATGQAKTRTLTDDELVSRNLEGLIAKDSQLLQRANQRALDGANRRGLINSSIAQGAATGAVIDAALPIAQADASAFINVADKNLANEQQTDLFNASQIQQNNQFNAGQDQSSSQFNANLLQDNNQFNAGLTQDLNKFNAGQSQSNNQFNAGQEQNNSQFNANLVQDLSKFNTSQTNTLNQFNASQAQQNNQFNAGQANDMEIVNASESNKILAQMMDAQNKLQLAGIEAQYKVTMQTQSSAMTLYQQSVKNISEILMNPDLDAAAKKAAVANQNSLLKSGMEIAGAMGGLDLGDLLDFSASAAAIA